MAAGFTIAPLQPRFTDGGASGECLVTLVLKADDLGGWLSPARAGFLVLPWLRSVLAQAAAGAVIALRDKVRSPSMLLVLPGACYEASFRQMRFPGADPPARGQGQDRWRVCDNNWATGTACVVGHVSAGHSGRAHHTC